MSTSRKVRPHLPGITSEHQSVFEQFQNTVLRPIIKMRHTVLIAVYRHYLTSKKVNFSDLSTEKQLQFIQSSLSKDIAFKNKVLGMILGQFTMEEMDRYLLCAPEYNKRVLQIVKKRLADSLPALV